MNKKYALAVGNNYPNTSAALNGCVNDANDWGSLLSALGYQVTVLYEATASNILEGINDLVLKTGFGDRAVFTFSGHGTWVPDTSGDESDGRDEALVGADFRDGRSGLVTDDAMQLIFSQARRGAAMLTLSDSCFSGTVSRFAPSAESESRTFPFDAQPQPRFLSPAVILPGLTAHRAAQIEAIPASDSRKTTSLVSGCSENEYSYDATFSGRGNGAFTRVAIDNFIPGMSLAAWHKAIRFNLPDTSYPQSPTLLASSTYRKFTRAL